MDILVLGGTAWLGREIVAHAVGVGHSVSCLNRGRAGAVPAGATAITADRDSPDAYRQVSGRGWDLVVDVTRQPGQARGAVAALADRAGRWAYVSSSSVYADHATIGADETADLLPALEADAMSSPADYGSAKVACEQYVLDGVGAERSCLARAGLIGGPGDHTDRTGYWPLRFARPAVPDTVLVPDAPDLATQVIDVRDLARWIVDEPRTGTFDVVGDRLRFADHLALAAEVGGFTGRQVIAPNDWLVERAVEPWMGERSLPLWLPDPEWAAMGGRDGSRARDAALRLRPLAETLADTLAWELSREPARTRRAGLSDADERELLAALDA